MTDCNFVRHLGKSEPAKFVRFVITATGVKGELLLRTGAAELVPLDRFYFDFRYQPGEFERGLHR